MKYNLTLNLVTSHGLIKYTINITSQFNVFIPEIIYGYGNLGKFNINDHRGRYKKHSNLSHFLRCRPKMSKNTTINNTTINIKNNIIYHVHIFIYIKIAKKKAIHLSQSIILFLRCCPKNVKNITINLP